MKIFSPIFRKRARSGVAGMRNTSGFTLLELIIVLSIGAIIMAIAIPMVQNLVKSKPADELVSMLHLARMMAIRQHRPVEAEIDFDTSKCTLSWENEDGSEGIKVWNLADSVEGYYFNDTPPGGAPASDPAFYFRPLGFISTNPNPTINVGGNIYLSERDNAISGPTNAKHFQIEITIAGGIELNRWATGQSDWVSAY